MNERIKDLAKEAGIQLPEDSVYNGHIYRNSLERFAQLIIKECANFADQHNQSKLYEDYDLGVGKAIKKHFGVE